MQGTAIARTERSRVEAVVETLAAMQRHGDSVAELAHDARNMVTALSLYCDLLEEPGVLAPPHHHYASELRLVAEGSRRLVEKLCLLDRTREPDAAQRIAASRQASLFPDASDSDRPSPSMEGGRIEDLREEVLAACHLLSAITGPSIAVSVKADGGAHPVAMTGENLIRALVNLVRNSAEAMSGTGTIAITVADRRDSGGQVGSVLLSLEDSGGGIPPQALERLFEPGFTTHVEPRGRRRGLGLSITRSIVEAAGGRIAAGNREPHGARFVIELPVEEGRDEGTRD